MNIVSKNRAPKLFYITYFVAELVKAIMLIYSCNIDNKKNGAVITLLISIILLASTGLANIVNVKASNCTEVHECPEFLEISFPGGNQIQIGEVQTIRVELIECDSARYHMLVLTPSGLEFFEQIKEWLENHDFNWFEFIAMFWSLDIAYYTGELDGVNPFEELSYPNDCDWEGGTPNTGEVGEYKVLVLGRGEGGPCAGECLCLCWKCFNTSFFVIHEFLLGTITPILTSLSILSLVGVLKKKRCLE